MAPKTEKRGRGAARPAQPAARPKRPTRRPAPAARTKPAAAAPARAPKGIRVRALNLGYYGDKRRRPGDVFEISSEELFSELWMERVDKATPKRETGPNEALRQHHDEVMKDRLQEPVEGSATGTGSADVLGGDD